MNTEFDFQSHNEKVVYVKRVDVADLPDDVRAKVGNHNELFAVHTEEGEQIALVTDRNTAFVLARQYDMTPVTVH